MLVSYCVDLSLTGLQKQDLKLKYYDLMIQYALQHSEYLDATKYYYKVWETPTIKAETTGRGKEVRPSLEATVSSILT